GQKPGTPSRDREYGRSNRLGQQNLQRLKQKAMINNLAQTRECRAELALAATGKSLCRLSGTGGKNYKGCRDYSDGSCGCTRMLSRFNSIVRSPIPFTRIRSSG